MQPIRLLFLILTYFALSTISVTAAETRPEPPFDGAYTTLTPEDVDLVSDATNRLLETGKPGSSTSWKNNQSGNYGTVKLERSFRSGGVLCKEINQVVKYSYVADVRLFKLTFCRIEGEWKLAE